MKIDRPPLDKGGLQGGGPRELHKPRPNHSLCKEGNVFSRSHELKQAILYGARDLRIEDSSLDCENLQPDQIYAETVVSALSTGTDLGNYLGDSTYVPGAPDYPRRIGYSNVAVVRRVGAAVAHPKVGQRIFSTQPHLSAYVARQSDILVTVPEAVSSEQASLAYLTHLGLAALRQANYLPGENVAIVGLGSLASVPQGWHEPWARK